MRFRIGSLFGLETVGDKSARNQIHLPGRDHHDLTVSLLYDSRIYELKANVDSFYGFVGYSWNAVDSGGWRLNLPGISKMQHCDPVGDFFDVYWADFTVTLPDGSKHHFDNTAGHAYHQRAWDGPITGYPNGQATGYTTDLSLRLDTPDAGNAVLHFRDGSSMDSDFLFLATCWVSPQAILCSTRWRNHVNISTKTT